MLETAPKPNFWRAPVDNDCGNQMPVRYAQWKLASMYLAHKAVDEEAFALSKPEIAEGEHSIAVTFTYNLNTMPAAQCQVTTSWRVKG